eukprot:TRINITY_DN643_c0_g1_i1.p1 TRINITY_DN643_c0_g1~~TRINITY_DN643_c0_g1_i1.p1  ORF type:complete len:554 (-),score=218.23 TRINITY_DN643_c0_g1_i1:85-1644(-)
MADTSIESLQEQIQKLTLEKEKLAKENEFLKQVQPLAIGKSGQYSSRKYVKKILAEGLSSVTGEEILVAGWARTIRDQKGLAFIDLNDGSTQNGLQVIVNPDCEGHADVVGLNAGIGACFIIKGKMVKGQGKQPTELVASHVELHGKCVPGEYPLAKSKDRPSAEKLREIGHLRGRTNKFSAMVRIRNACAMATHHFFQQHGFIYLHTPLITASDCEGAGEMFQVTTLLKGGEAKLSDVKTVQATGKPDYTQDFFGKPAFLTVSGQLNGEMYATAVGKIYTFGPTFRAENSHTKKHAAEFWMIEPEIAFADLEENMDTAEAYLKFVIQYVRETCSEEIQFCDAWVEKGLSERLLHAQKTPFKRISYTDAVQTLIDSKHKFEVDVKWGMDLGTEHERYLTDTVFKQPVIVFDYPKDIKAFYMRLNEDGKTVRAMDVLVPGIGELMGGSQREERLEKLTTRIKDCGLDEVAYKAYLDLRRFGTCVHSGFGLGFERLVMFISGIDNIRDAIPFFRVPGSADF